MKPDTPRGTRLDRVERAHLKDPADRSHAIYRYDPPADLTSLIQRYWIPVWSVPRGQEAPQRVLQYPVALLVITPEPRSTEPIAGGTAEGPRKRLPELGR